MPAIVAASAATALQLVDLLVQAVEFLLRQLALVFGLLQRTHHAFKIAQDRFETVPNAIDLTAQNAIVGALAFIAHIAAPATIAITSTVITAVPSAIAITAAVAATIRFTRAQRRPFGFAMFAVRLRPFFVKFVRFMRLVRRRFGNTLPFRRIIDCGGHIRIILVTRAIFALGIARTKFVLVACNALFAHRFRRIIFTWGSIISTGRSTAATTPTAARRGTTPSAAATAPAAITITRIATFTGTRTFAASNSGTAWRGSTTGFRFRITVFGSGLRGCRSFPTFQRGLSRRFGGAFRAA